MKRFLEKEMSFIRSFIATILFWDNSFRDKSIQVIECYIEMNRCHGIYDNVLNINLFLSHRLHQKLAPSFVPTAPINVPEMKSSRTKSWLQSKRTEISGIKIEWKWKQKKVHSSSFKYVIWCFRKWNGHNHTSKPARYHLCSFSKIPLYGVECLTLNTHTHTLRNGDMNRAMEMKAKTEMKRFEEFRTSIMCGVWSVEIYRKLMCNLNLYSSLARRWLYTLWKTWHTTMLRHYEPNNRRST